MLIKSLKMSNKNPNPSKGFLKTTPTEDCKNFNQSFFCSRGTMCKYKHNYHQGNQIHILSYLDGIVATQNMIIKKLDQVSVKFGLDESKSDPSSSASAGSRSRPSVRDMTKIAKKSRSRSRDKDISEFKIPLIEPIFNPGPSQIHPDQAKSLMNPHARPFNPL
ncbi:hypothetical protein 4 [Hubei rhabdo-like virus 3]|uniref:C3H1-type domain-containing protein n=1 Tax=Hubei rhabdo-like virus 3 TaxID=1923187 RepID=A0A1L3KMV1_9MONO|nr:hypothetical protein 4 [Hubei rhabdo-like virus 3]APG78693.1 hypothetical protein 4 [Hubei rhabdo-like virus 3]